jgi:hypothetical protein
VAVNEKVGDVDTITPPSVQLTKEYPLLGLATIVTRLPASLLPPPLVVPPVTGLEVVAIA